MIDRAIAPNILNATEFNFNLPDIDQKLLPNGIPFYVYKGGAQEVLSIELIFDAGVWFQNKPAVAGSTISLLRNGTSKKTAFQISEAFDFYGANLNCSIGNDVASVGISCMSKHVKHVLPLLFEVLTDSIFPEDELKIYKQSTIQRLSINNKKCDIVGNRKIDELLFSANHPYGQYNIEQDYTNLEANDLKKYLFQYFSSSNCKIFLTGFFTKEVETEIEQIFGKGTWNADVKPHFPTHTILQSTEMKHRIVNDVNGVQGAIRISSPFVEKAHTDFIPMQLVNTLFGGFFGSRLMDNIREDKGYTYGIHSYIYNQKQSGGFGIATEAGKDVCEATIVEVYKEMEIMRTELVDDEELQLVKNYLLGRIKSDLDGPFKVMQRWKNLILFGFEKSRYEQSIEIYKSITAKEIQALSNKYLQPNLFFEVVVV